MSKRGETWSEQETLHLITIWENVSDVLNSVYKSARVYKDIACQMVKAGYHRDFQQCRTKIKHLKNLHKKYKDSLNRSGAGRKKEPLYFGRLDNLLGDRAQAVGLKRGVDTSASTSCETPTSPSVVDEESELIEKYGEGEKHEQDCPQCGWVVADLHSAGVHVESSGVVKIYSEADVFECPKCFFKDSVPEDNIGAEEDVSAPISSAAKKPDVMNLCNRKEDGNNKDINSLPKKEKKEKKEKKQSAVVSALNSFMEYQKSSDEAYVKFLHEQSAAEVDLRKAEMQMHYDAMIKLANAIAQPNTTHASFQSPAFQSDHQVTTQAIVHTYHGGESGDKEATYFEL